MAKKNTNKASPTPRAKKKPPSPGIQPTNSPPNPPVSPPPGGTTLSPNPRSSPSSTLPPPPPNAPSTSQATTIPAYTEQRPVSRPPPLSQIEFPPLPSATKSTLVAIISGKLTTETRAAAMAPPVTKFPWAKHLRASSRNLPRLATPSYSEAGIPRNISAELYSLKGISYIASGIGEPLHTERMRVDPSSVGEACVKVEIQLGSTLPDLVEIEDDKGGIIGIKVNYAWIPPRCLTCE
ncbi:PREDICTED: proline-rich receptor-like protein kinase PERK2 [Tarenaya hassleriana]|uniref:proline-rich receptor-like protein kinase PERK2 n=1 Tax=Tarenaya hassleriana TaxID=28532 RepID=UPI00053C8DA9|nr:PREDICTED: proline-rich receptor-like protein kinase PERK2 [Tarenaya hassleriana]